jgi:hypothetical protein
MMNELKQIRSMAEMILEKVNALEGSKTFPQNGFREFVPEVKNESKFAIGDRVRTTNGDQGRVTGIHKLDGHYRYRYLVLFDNGDHHHVVEPLLKLIKAKPKFKVGDRVTHGRGESCLGLGIVEETCFRDDIHFYTVRWVDQGGHVSHPSETYLRAYDEPKPKFAIGDRVVYDFDGTTKIGTVTQGIGPWYVVEWDDGTNNSVHDSDGVRLVTNNDREWHTGPPPHVGWWLTDYKAEEKYPCWRWWNGFEWSIPSYSHLDAEVAAAYASIPASRGIADLNWCDYWPENARVPRVDPGV